MGFHTNTHQSATTLKPVGFPAEYCSVVRWSVLFTLRQMLWLIGVYPCSVKSKPVQNSRPLHSNLTSVENCTCIWLELACKASTDSGCHCTEQACQRNCPVIWNSGEQRVENENMYLCVTNIHKDPSSYTVAYKSLVMVIRCCSGKQ